MSSRRPRRKRGDPSSEEEEEASPPPKRTTRASTRNTPSTTSNTSTSTSKRSTSNAKASKGKGPPGLSKAEEATRRDLEKRRTAAAVALKKKEDEEIRKRTAAMLEQERQETQDDSDSSLPPAPPPKRKKKAHTPLDEDEEAFAASLGNPMDLDLDFGLKKADINDDDNNDDNGNGNEEENQGDDEYPAESDEGELVKQDQIDGQLDFEDTSNGIDITDAPAKPKGKGQRRSASTVTATSASPHTKLSEHDFSPAEYRLACLAKTKIRERISLENAWPDDNKDAFTWATLKQVVESNGNDNMEKVFQKASQDEGLKERLIIYVFYTVGGLRGDIKRRAKGNISGHFQIPGTKTPQQIEKQVRWLLHLDHFMYGDIKYDDKTDKYSYNKDAPFSHQIIADIIREQWFSTKGKNDKPVFRYMVEKKLVPHQIIVLVICGAESSLKEWQSGIRQNLEFCYDAIKSRYLHYMKKWNTLASRSPTFASYLEKILFNNIILSLGKPHLAEEKEEEDGLEDFDFDGMEAFAQTQGI